MPVFANQTREKQDRGHSRVKVGLIRLPQLVLPSIILRRQHRPVQPGPERHQQRGVNIRLVDLDDTQLLRPRVLHPRLHGGKVPARDLPLRVAARLLARDEAQPHARHDLVLRRPLELDPRARRPGRQAKVPVGVRLEDPPARVGHVLHERPRLAHGGALEIGAEEGVVLARPERGPVGTVARDARAVRVDADAAPAPRVVQVVEVHQDQGPVGHLVAQAVLGGVLVRESEAVERRVLGRRHLRSHRVLEPDREVARLRLGGEGPPHHGPAERHVLALGDVVVWAPRVHEQGELSHRRPSPRARVVQVREPADEAHVLDVAGRVLVLVGRVGDGLGHAVWKSRAGEDMTAIRRPDKRVDVPQNAPRRRDPLWDGVARDDEIQDRPSERREPRHWDQNDDQEEHQRVHHHCPPAGAAIEPFRPVRCADLLLVLGARRQRAARHGRCLARRRGRGLHQGLQPAQMQILSRSCGVGCPCMERLVFDLCSVRSRFFM